MIKYILENKTINKHNNYVKIKISHNVYKIYAEIIDQDILLIDMKNKTYKILYNDFKGKKTWLNYLIKNGYNLI